MVFFFGAYNLDIIVMNLMRGDFFFVLFFDFFGMIYLIVGYQICSYSTDLDN